MFRFGGWVGVAACGGGVAGDYRGECTFDGIGGERALSLSLTFEAPDEGGVGFGHGRVTEDQEAERGDILFEYTGETVIAVDVYLDGPDLFLRGARTQKGFAGSCERTVPKTMSVDTVLDCLFELDPGCDDKKWEPDLEHVAPLVAHDLNGAFSLREQ